MDPRESLFSVAGLAHNCVTGVSREDRPQCMPDNLDVVHEQDPDDVFMSRTVLSSWRTVLRSRPVSD
jgi:hypothetical protein